MTKWVPPSFDEARVLDGLHQAMGFGEPNAAEDKATFFKVSTSTTAPADSEGVPFDPAATRTTTPTSVQVPCAVEYQDVNGEVITAGTVQPARVVITLLGPDYEQVKGFSYVACGGDRYYYSRTEPPVALGTIDVWTVHAQSLDQR